jgi:YHYH protein
MKNIILFCTTICLFGCNKSADLASAPSSNTDGTTTNDFARLYAKMYNVISVDSTSKTEMVVKTNNEPDHKSPFFNVASSKYEAYNGDNPNFSTSINLGGTIADPDLISKQVTICMPRYPLKASTHKSTTGGPIGVARNGVVFFNQYNGNNAALDALEINNVDQYLGHPTPTNAGAQYHYHFEPKFLTTKYGNSAFMGFLLDGFPVYGPWENGVKVTQSSLDEYNGHVSATEDYPNDKIYHYHIISASSSLPTVLTAAAPYINGGKYYGTKGSGN